MKFLLKTAWGILILTICLPLFGCSEATVTVTETETITEAMVLPTERDFVIFYPDSLSVRVRYEGKTELQPEADGYHTLVYITNATNTVLDVGIISSVPFPAQLLELHQQYEDFSYAYYYDDGVARINPSSTILVNVFWETDEPIENASAILQAVIVPTE